ncbi:MAG: hypothetical protein IPJ30_28010 [Acidobacteria bacterium]|nr:hypothetical protein [Acidobacteriota bacterium]
MRIPICDLRFRGFWRFQIPDFGFQIPEIPEIPDFGFQIPEIPDFGYFGFRIPDSNFGFQIPDSRSWTSDSRFGIPNPSFHVSLELNLKNGITTQQEQIRIPNPKSKFPIPNPIHLAFPTWTRAARRSRSPNL